MTYYGVIFHLQLIMVSKPWIPYVELHFHWLVPDEFSPHVSPYLYRSISILSAYLTPTHFRWSLSFKICDRNVEHFVILMHAAYPTNPMLLYLTVLIIFGEVASHYQCVNHIPE